MHSSLDKLTNNELCQKILCCKWIYLDFFVLSESSTSSVLYVITQIWVKKDYNNYYIISQTRLNSRLNYKIQANIINVLDEEVKFRIDYFNRISL